MLISILSRRLKEGNTYEEAARHERIAEVIEPEMARAFYVQVGDDDLTDEPPKS
jgi:hypothetical protein